MKEVEFSPTAHHQLMEWEKNDEKVYLRIDELLKAIQDEPFKGIGKPEPLKYQFQGYWSRRITKKDRLVYQVTHDAIIVISCKYHY
ncbi:MAG: Txe/YoeB family addiction module toxin [Bacteroidetes bacterium CG_4_10_14_3_um_filter_31_20]|nr:MAG: Txe/YoeB family addiction module toxin [Bacteroidetes bacterium CG_4_8_14_3_um_filter_31_14]PIY02162.1 MAG: Txe/YoeB family addiction module toxin [Bacteroidetes bacterium CG_4_10_14_3_um_filter_31_20]